MMMSPACFEVPASLLEKSKSFGINPARFRKSATPLGGGYITSFVPVGGGDPVEEFSQTRLGIFCSPALQQCGGHLRIRPRTANDGIEQRRVPAEALNVSCSAGVDIGPACEQPIEDFPFAKIDGEVQQRAADNWSPVHARAMSPAATFRRIDFVLHKPALD